jgi:hypothetical protein
MSFSCVHRYIVLTEFLALLVWEGLVAEGCWTRSNKITGLAFSQLYLLLGRGLLVMEATALSRLPALLHCQLDQGSGSPGFRMPRKYKIYIPQLHGDPRLTTLSP